MCVALWLVVRLYQQAAGCGGEGTDVDLYRNYAAQLRSGGAAAPEFRPEYPPAALTLFMLPLLVGGEEIYQQCFAALMALFDLGACLLVFHRARLRPRAPPNAPFFHATLYLLMTAALWPVLHARFDIVPAALALAALHGLDRHRERWSAAILGVAGAVKLWPFALLPLWIAGTPWRRLRHAHARAALARTLAIGICVAAGAAIASLPVLPLLGNRVLSSARYLADRGLQIESTWAALALVFDQLGLAETTAEEAYGATQLAGRLPSMFAAISLPATVPLVALPVVVLFAIGRRLSTGGAERSVIDDSSDDRSVVLEQGALAIILGSMIAAKVLSPQFVLWIAPLLALAARGPIGATLAFVTAALTTDVYPERYEALVGVAPGHGRALLSLVARNALLVGWYVVAIHRLTQHRARPHRPRALALPGPVLPLSRSWRGGAGR